MMTEISSGPSQSTGELLEKISGTAVKIFGYVAGSVGLLYAIGFTIVNIDLLRHGVYEVGILRARYISVGVFYLVLIALLALIVFTCLYLVDRFRNGQDIRNLLISLIPILLICFFIAMVVSDFRAVRELDLKQFNIPLFLWCLAFSLFLLLMMGSGRIPKIKDIRSKLEPGGTSELTSLGRRFAVIGIWCLVAILFIVILYCYGQYVYQTFPSAWGGGRPIVVQFTGEESSLAELGQIGIRQLEPGLTEKVELIAQTETNYIVLVPDPVLKSDVAVSFSKSFTRGIKYYPEEHYLSREYRVEKYTAEGSKYLGEGNFDAAVEQFDRALRLDDAYVPTLLGKGKALIGSANYNQAIYFYNKKLIRPDKELNIEEGDLASAQYGLAQAYAGRGRFEEAINSLKKAFDLDGALIESAKSDELFFANNELSKVIFQGYENAAIWFGQEGDKLKESGDLDGSIEMYKKATSLSQAAGDEKSEANYLYRLFEVYMLENDIKNASDQINQAISLAPENTVYLLGLARVYMDQNEFEKARDQYQAVIEIKPDSPVALIGLGNARLALGDYVDAESAYRAVIEVDPSNASGYYGLARMEAIQGKNEDAISDFQRAVSLNPTLREKSQDDEAFDNIRDEIERLNTGADHNNQGNQLQEAGEIDQAIDEYLKAVTLDPSNATYHANLGMAYQQQERLADAEAEFVAAISYAPGNDRYYFLLGEVKFEGGDLKGAIDNYAMALDLNDQNPIYHAGIAEAYSKSGNLQAAIDEYGKAIDLDQNNPKYLFQFARTLTDYGSPDEAIPYFDDVLNLDPDYSDAYCGLAIAHQDAGDTEDAKDNLDKCFELSTNEVLVKEAQQKITD